MADLRDQLQSTLGTAYSVERELAGGAMSRVFVATETALGRPVVVKVLPPETSGGVSSDRFKREVLLAARLQHPCIVPLLSAGEAGIGESASRLLYYTMPFVAGDSLRHRLETAGELPVPEAVRILRDITAALSYAHAQGVVHRDLKPDNVLLSGGYALVTDFGVAKALSAAATASGSVTGTAVVVGTPLYMSPEQAAGDPAVDHRADLYGLGVVAYELLTGAPPFVGRSPQALIAAHVADVPEPLVRRRPSVPVPLADLVMRLLAKRPADRPQSADVVLRELDALGALSPDGGARARTHGAEVSDHLQGSAQPLPRPEANAHPARTRLVVAGAVLLVTMFAATWLAAKRRSDDSSAAGTLGTGVTTRPAAATDPPSVAVMPFDDLGGDASRFGEGMTEEIINQLAQVEGLKIISRRSVTALEGSKLTLPQIADTLGVRHVVLGSVRGAGDRVRVSVQLVEARTDSMLWARSYNHRLTDAFQVQDSIAREVSARLVATVRGLRPVTGGSRTDDPEAYSAYLTGTAAMYARTVGGLTRAIRAFEEATRRDSTYAPGFSGLAAANVLSLVYGYQGSFDRYESIRRALRAADRAIALDSAHAEGYATRAYARMRSWGPAALIEPEFRRALALRPNSADINAWYHIFLSREGRHEEAVAGAVRAVELDPVHPGHRMGLALTAMGAREYDITLREAEQALRLEPMLDRPRVYKAIVFLIQGRPAECTALDLGVYAGVRAACLHALDRAREAAATADSLEAVFEKRRDDAELAGSIAIYHAWRGDTKRTLHWLEQSFAASPMGLEFRYLYSGAFDRVRDDPVFKTRVERLRADAWARVEHGRGS